MNAWSLCYRPPLRTKFPISSIFGITLCGSCTSASLWLWARCRSLFTHGQRNSPACLWTCLFCQVVDLPHSLVGAAFALHSHSGFFFPPYKIVTMSFSFARRYEARRKAGKPLPNSENVMALAYSVYSALFGSTSVVFAKASGCHFEGRLAVLLIIFILGGQRNCPKIIHSVAVPLFYRNSVVRRNYWTDYIFPFPRTTRPLRFSS